MLSLNAGISLESLLTQIFRHKRLIRMVPQEETYLPSLLYDQNRTGQRPSSSGITCLTVPSRLGSIEDRTGLEQKANFSGYVYTEKSHLRVRRRS